jgi:DMSO/TMAO reductase YedYZ molybdopterin-dependent catalytic subunit
MTEPTEKVLEQLPVFPDVTPDGEWCSLSVEGLVATPLDLGQDDLTALGRGELVDDFRCVEGWVVPDQQWEGIPVAALVDMAGPLAEAAYVAFSAGGYTVGMTLAEALESNVIVALRLNGQWLSTEHGGPCRLMALGQACYFSVKWLDRIQLMAGPPQETGQAITQARNAGRQS